MVVNVFSQSAFGLGIGSLFEALACLSELGLFGFALAPSRGLSSGWTARMPWCVKQLDHV